MKNYPYNSPPPPPIPSNIQTSSTLNSDRGPSKISPSHFFSNSSTPMNHKNIYFDDDSDADDDDKSNDNIRTSMSHEIAYGTPIVSDMNHIPPLPSKPRPTISYALTDEGYKPKHRTSIGSSNGDLNNITPMSLNNTPKLKPGDQSFEKSGVFPAYSSSIIEPSFQWSGDSPDFWRQLTMLKATCSRFSNRLNRDSASLGPECLCSSPVSLLHYSETIGQTSPNLNIDGTTIVRLINQVSELREDLNFKLNVACQKEDQVFNQVRSAHEIYAKYEEQKQRHIEKVRAYLTLKSSTDSKKLFEKSVKLSNNEHALELDRFHIFATLSQVKENAEYSLVRPLAERLSALLEFFEAGTAVLAPFADAIDAITRYSLKLEGEAEERRLHFEYLAKEVEKESVDSFRMCDNIVDKAPPEKNIFGNLGHLKKETTQENVGIRDLDYRRKTANMPERREGYLYLPNKDCERVWVEVGNETISVYDSMKNEVIHSLPLLLSTIKQCREHKCRFVFNVITPQNTIFLQAESDAALHAWLDGIQNSIGRNLNVAGDDHAHMMISSVIAKKHQSITTNQNTGASGILQNLWSIPGNDRCADCGISNPDWLSINLGILICLECSSAHRLMGVDISKVRSANMDVIEESTQHYIASIGNNRANDVFLANKSNISIDVDTNRTERIRYIQDKYQHLKWACSTINNIPIPTINKQRMLDSTLLNGIRINNVNTAYTALVMGARPEQVAPGNEGRTCIHEAVMHTDLTMCVCVLMFSDNLVLRDERGWTPLHYAAYSNKVQLIELCLGSSGSNLSVERDYQNRTPLMIAQEMNVGAEYAHELPFVIQALKKAEDKYAAKIQRNRM